MLYIIKHVGYYISVRMLPQNDNINLIIISSLMIIYIFS